MKRDNFYRRDPGLALQGMSSMSLEERGVYNTVIDLLYLTWRPLEDDRGYIAGHCRCAVQKLNPILNRLIEMGKLIRFEEAGRTYISNQKFEDERTDVKGSSPTRSGRQVKEKSAGVREKSASVEENAPLLDMDTTQNQSVTALERVEKSRKKDTNVSSVAEGDAKDAFDEWNVLAKRLGLPLAKDLTDQRRKALRSRLAKHGIAGWREALQAVEASDHCRGENDRSWRADIDFVCQPKSFQRLREGFYGGTVPAGPATPASVFDGPQQLRAMIVKATDEGFTISYLDPAHWRASDRTLVAKTGIAADKLANDERVKTLLAKHHVAVVGPDAAPHDLPLLVAAE